MSYLRHASRHVLASVMLTVQDGLDTLGWMDAGTLPFGSKYAAVVHFSDAPAIAGDKLADEVAAGLVAVTLGPEFPVDMDELGGPLARQDYPIFFDVFQPEYATTTALANDIRDILMGRVAGTNRYVVIKDQTDDSTVLGWTCELTDVEIVRPELRLPLHWQVVKVTAEVHFPEVQW
jgi:hypothetical protein